MSDPSCYTEPKNSKNGPKNMKNQTSFHAICHHIFMPFRFHVPFNDSTVLLRLGYHLLRLLLRVGPQQNPMSPSPQIVDTDLGICNKDNYEP